MHNPGKKPALRNGSPHGARPRGCLQRAGHSYWQAPIKTLMVRGYKYYMEFVFEGIQCVFSVPTRPHAPVCECKITLVLSMFTAQLSTAGYTQPESTGNPVLTDLWLPAGDNEPPLQRVAPKNAQLLQRPSIHSTCAYKVSNAASDERETKDFCTRHRKKDRFCNYLAIMKKIQV